MRIWLSLTAVLAAAALAAPTLASVDSDWSKFPQGKHFSQIIRREWGNSYSLQWRLEVAPGIYLCRTKDGATYLSGSERRPAWGVGPYFYRVTLPEVANYGVEGAYILGRTEVGAYLAPLKDPGLEHLQEFERDHTEQWRVAMEDRGISGKADWVDPDKEALKRSPVELRPWDYRWLDGLGGLTDAQWGWRAMFALLAVGVVAGLLCRSQGRVQIPAIIIGLAAAAVSIATAMLGEVTCLADLALGLAVGYTGCQCGYGLRGKKATGKMQQAKTGD